MVARFMVVAGGWWQIDGGFWRGLSWWLGWFDTAASGGDGGGAVRGYGCKLWMLRCSGTSIFYPFASRSRGIIYVLHVSVLGIVLLVLLLLLQLPLPQNPPFWSCFSYIFVFFVFWEERDIKFEQKYLFTHDFNRGGLRKTNGTYLKWVKWHISNHG